jgi:hypothetical protein
MAHPGKTFPKGLEKPEIFLLDFDLVMAYSIACLAQGMSARQQVSQKRAFPKPSSGRVGISETAAVRQTAAVSFNRSS